MTLVEKAVAAAHEVRLRLGPAGNPAVQPSIEDMRAQLVALVHPGFVTATGVRAPARPAALPAALGVRLEQLPANPARDRDWMAQVPRGPGPSTTTCSRPCRRTGASPTRSARSAG